MKSKKKKNILWDTVYILGAENVTTGKLPVATETGEIKVEHVVITGIKPNEIPYWDLPVPPMAEIHRVPKKKTSKAFAIEMNGIAAFGWYFKGGFRRKTTRNPITVMRAKKFKNTFFKECKVS